VAQSTTEGCFVVGTCDSAVRKWGLLHIPLGRRARSRTVGRRGGSHGGFGDSHGVGSREVSEQGREVGSGQRAGRKQRDGGHD